MQWFYEVLNLGLTYFLCRISNTFSNTKKNNKLVLIIQVIDLKRDESRYST